MSKLTTVFVLLAGRSARCGLGVSMLASAVANSGCLEETRYAVEREEVRMPPGDAPTFVDEDDNAIFVAEERFYLPIRPPQEMTLAQLSEGAQGRELPFPRLPWVEREDLEVRVDYAIENRSEEQVSALVFIDGVNEFFEYTPGPEDFHQYERRILLEPGQRVERSVSELEMDEIAIDLATVVNGAPNTAQIVTAMSQSSRDPRAQEFIPSVVPGLVAFRMGIQVAAEGEDAVSPSMMLKLSARVQDHGDRIAARGEARWSLPEPVEFVPVVPEEEP